MKGAYRYRGTLASARARWPTFLLVYAALVAGLSLIMVSAQQGWWSLVPFFLVLLLPLLYFTLASLWAAHKIYDPGGLRPHHVLFEMAQIQENHTLAYIDLASRHRAIELAQRLTSGQVIVIDVYSPQWAPGRALARQRERMSTAPTDPRLDWRSGEIGLMPLPDHSVSTAIVCLVMNEFWQHGDRQVLLKEVHRILKPNGRVLVAERARSRANWLVMGPMAIGLPSLEQWRRLLVAAGFQLRSERELEGLIHCFRADKPTRSAGEQLPLELTL